MDLVMDEKAVAANESPQVLSAQQAMLTQMMAQSMSSVQPSFNSGVPTLLTPSQMSSFSISPIQPPTTSTSKYAQLLQVIEELGKDIRPTYSGSKSSAERLKRGIIHARILVRECLMETERNNARN